MKVYFSLKSFSTAISLVQPKIRSSQTKFYLKWSKATVNKAMFEPKCFCVEKVAKLHTNKEF